MNGDETGRTDRGQLGPSPLWMLTLVVVATAIALHVLANSAPDPAALESAAASTTTPCTTWWSCGTMPLLLISIGIGAGVVVSSAAYRMWTEYRPQ